MYNNIDKNLKKAVGWGNIKSIGQVKKIPKLKRREDPEDLLQIYFEIEEHFEGENVLTKKTI